MKAILEYELPQEQEEFQLAQKGILYSIVLNELDNYLRGKIKYEELSEETYNNYQSIRDKLHEIANQHGVQV